MVFHSVVAMVKISLNYLCASFHCTCMWITMLYFGVSVGERLLRAHHFVLTVLIDWNYFKIFIFWLPVAWASLFNSNILLSFECQRVIIRELTSFDPPCQMMFNFSVIFTPACFWAWCCINCQMFSFSCSKLLRHLQICKLVWDGTIPGLGTPYSRLPLAFFMYLIPWSRKFVNFTVIRWTK